MAEALRQQDEATRFLSAAVHLDPVLAELLIDEYLAEPKRAVPPSPGVSAELVLREALAARAQRRNLNTVLVVLAAVMAIGAAPLLIGWYISAACWRLSERIVQRIAAAANKSAVPSSAPPNWTLTALVWSALSFLWAWTIVGMLLVLGMVGSGAVVGSLVIGSLLPLGMYLILVLEQVLPWRTVLSHFRFGTYDPDVTRRAEVLSECVEFESRLARIAAEDSRRAGTGSGEIVIYRGDAPFQGAGSRVRSWSSVFQLRAKSPKGESDAAVPRFRPSELQAFISDRVGELAKAEFLTPGSRFEEATVTEWAVISAAQLPYHPRAERMLRQLDAGVDPELSVENWREIADCSPEWLRYFRCFRVEGWGRQLAVSGFLHIGCVERLLVVEWHGFLLSPIAAEFRQVDQPPEHLEWKALRESVAELALLPLTMFARAADVVRSMRRGGGGSWSSPAQAAMVFGSRASIRELASGTRLSSFFQESDAQRYLKIMERCTLDAIAQFAEERGIVVKGFDEMVTQINSSTIFNNSHVTAGNIGGAGNSGTVESAGAAGESATE
ncbi:hypothetical protein [Nocardia asteroides]|uniref:hypothetical protein n=1 Tax=Nocardia asteroides TaxID=1824 RepID=UPI001E4C5778|nr:hypothetical protein [Nocardia asteroides]UGT53405.1 hypothetical protein LTT85_22310 [Nocardia asteroides]